MNTQNSLVRTIKKHGANNIQFKIKSGGRYLGGNQTMGKITEIYYEITEETYKVEDGYKIGLEPFAPAFSIQNFYQMDLIELIRDKQVTMEDPDGNPIDLE